jgi:hypothetical protein
MSISLGPHLLQISVWFFEREQESETRRVQMGRDIGFYILSLVFSSWEANTASYFDHLLYGIARYLFINTTGPKSLHLYNLVLPHSPYLLSLRLQN